MMSVTIEKIETDSIIVDQEVFEEIIKFQGKNKKEIGGIIGGYSNHIIYVLLDYGLQVNRNCSYIPNTKYLNEGIDEWGRRGIEFLGVFHTHFNNVSTLSDADKIYIEKIMNNMPKNIIRLYFPVMVMPKGEMVFYKASKT